MYYLTPAQLRALNLGLDFSDFTDGELAPLIARATSAVNAYCNVPTIPEPHNLLGGEIVGETHTWSIDPYATQPQRRVFPYHRPVIEVISMRIYATSTQYLSFDAAELYYEASEGWIEPASANLTSWGLFGSAVLPFVGLSEPHAVLDYTYGRLIPKTERLWYAGQGGNTWRGISGFWTNDAIEVRVNGSVADDGDYTIDRTEGAILWTDLSTRPSGTDTVEADVVTRQHPDLALATGMTVASLFSDRELLRQGMPLGVRAFRVAEVSVERDFRRSAQATSVVPMVPLEAEELLAPFVYRPLRFG